MMSIYLIALNRKKMARYIQFTPIGSKDVQSLSVIDQEVCDLLGAPIHKEYYGGSGPNRFNWFDSIGFQLSYYGNYDEVKEFYNNNINWGSELPIISKIIDFLESKYTIKAWSR